MKPLEVDESKINSKVRIAIAIVVIVLLWAFAIYSVIAPKVVASIFFYIIVVSIIGMLVLLSIAIYYSITTGYVPRMKN